MKTNADRILEIIKQEVDSNIDFENLEYDIPLSDQGMDSLDRSSMFLGIEEEYDIEITDEDIESLTSVNEIVDYVNNK